MSFDEVFGTRAFAREKERFGLAFVELEAAANVSFLADERKTLSRLIWGLDNGYFVSTTVLDAKTRKELKKVVGYIRKVHASVGALQKSPSGLRVLMSLEPSPLTDLGLLSSLIISPWTDQITDLLNTMPRQANGQRLQAEDDNFLLELMTIFDGARERLSVRLYRHARPALFLEEIKRQSLAFKEVFPADVATTLKRARGLRRRSARHAGAGKSPLEKF